MGRWSASSWTNSVVVLGSDAIVSWWSSSAWGGSGRVGSSWEGFSLLDSAWSWLASFCTRCATNSRCLSIPLLTASAIFPCSNSFSPDSAFSRCCNNVRGTWSMRPRLLVRLFKPSRQIAKWAWGMSVFRWMPAIQ